MNFHSRQHVSFAILGALVLVACQTSKLAQSWGKIQQSIVENRMEDALHGLNTAMASSARGFSLLLLERALVHQQMGRYEDSRSDFLRADEEFEVIDFSGEPGEDFALLMARPKQAEYRGTPYEKILLNTLNIINHLALSDLEQGRVEARRAMVMHDSVVSYERKQEFENPLTELLFGCLFEASGRPNDAHLAYKNCFESTGATFLKSRLLWCAQESDHSDLGRWTQEFGEQPSPVPEGHGTVVVILMNGQAPLRRPTTTPDRKIRYAELTPRPHRFRSCGVRIGELPPRRLAKVLDIEEQALAYFESVEKMTLSGAALKGLSSPSGARMYNVADTRCWKLLPAEVLVGILAVPAGRQRVELSLEGDGSGSRSREIDVQVGGFHVAQFFVRE